MKKQKLPKAAALKYDGENAPRVIAKGEGVVAEQILSLALENDVHVHQDPHLMEVLTKLELGEEIPHQLYLAVAKIIAFAYMIQGKHPNFKKSHSKSIRTTTDDEVEPAEDNNVDIKK